jgi:hypothetical protein
MKAQSDKFRISSRYFPIQEESGEKLRDYRQNKTKNKTKQKESLCVRGQKSEFRDNNLVIPS